MFKIKNQTMKCLDPAPFVLMLSSSSLSVWVTNLKHCTGQLVSYEVVDATASSCPVELVKIQVPDNDSEFHEKSSSDHRSGFPFLRSAYNPETGNAPNRPRQPVCSNVFHLESEVRAFTKHVHRTAYFLLSLFGNY